MKLRPLDTESERADSGKALDELQKNRTSSGDCTPPSTIEQADEIVVKSKMVLSLSAALHSELLAQHGRLRPAT